MKKQHPIRKIKPPFQVIDEAASVSPEMWDKLLALDRPGEEMSHERTIVCWMRRDRAGARAALRGGGE